MLTVQSDQKQMIDILFGFCRFAISKTTQADLLTMSLVIGSKMETVLVDVGLIRYNIDAQRLIILMEVVTVVVPSLHLPMARRRTSFANYVLNVLLKKVSELSSNLNIINMNYSFCQQAT